MFLEQKDLSGILETAIVAARLAGQHAMEQIQFAKAVKKSENELVTQTDAECQQIIIQRIRDLSDHGFIAEGEKGRCSASAQGRPISGGRRPIDGTNNFAWNSHFHGQRGSTVRGRPVVGVITGPLPIRCSRRQRRQAQLGGRHIVASETVRRGASASTAPRGLCAAWVCGSSPGTVPQPGPPPCMAYVAKGGLVAPWSHPAWDIAAGTVITRRPALVTDWQGGKIFPVDPDHYEGQTFQVLVANRRVHAKLLQTINA
jgi:fructose-1,6-bisphosphatase/inositol monophosphatase family enzyme